jgi:hypothetical protein
MRVAAAGTAKAVGPARPEQSADAVFFVGEARAKVVEVGRQPIEHKRATSEIERLFLIPIYQTHVPVSRKILKKN